MAKEVVNQTWVKSYDRSLKERNVIIFGRQEPNVDEKKKDEEFLNSLFNYIGVKKDKLKYYRLEI